MAQDKTNIHTYPHTRAGKELAVMQKHPVPPVPPVPSFSDWLLAYSRNNRIGDLAADVRRDPPRPGWGYTELRRHMLSRGACLDAMKSLEAAKRAYYRHASACC